MAILRIEGLLYGDRMRLLSNNARLYYPYLYLLANNFGRMEMDFVRIQSRFATFNPPPSVTEVREMFVEYVKAHLIFVYKCPNGSHWGQWETDERNLSPYKTKEDHQSPSPDESALSVWRGSYITEKNGVEDFYKVCENSCVVLGVGVGVVSVKPFRSSGDEQASDPNAAVGAPDERHEQPGATEAAEPPVAWELHPEEPASSHALKESSLAAKQLIWFENEFWPISWRKVSKADALRAFRKHATSESKKNTIVEAVKAWTPNMLARDPQYRMYMASWLNKLLYEESPEDLSAIKKEDDPW